MNLLLPTWKAAELKYWLGLILICTLVMLQTGCRSLGRRKDAPPTVFNGPASRDQIIAAVNANSSRVNQLESRLKLSVPGLPAITGDLAVERPKRLRMQAGFMGTSAGGIDVGSNEDVFWLWVKSALGGQEPAVYYGRHDQYASSQARQAIPVDPAFLMDSIGLYTFAPDATHEGPYSRADGMIEMRSRRQTASGESVHIVIIDRRSGTVTEQHLYEKNALAASSYASNFKYDKEYLVALPQTVQLIAMPGTVQEMKLTIKADEYTINQLYAGPALWEMPQPDGISVINVANAAPHKLSMRPVGMNRIRRGQNPSSDQSARSRLGNALYRYRGGRLLQRR